VISRPISVLLTRVIKAILLLAVILTAGEYARWTYFADSRWARAIVLELQEKPFVYRALVPWLAHLLALLGLSNESALTIVVVCSAIGLLYGIKYLLAAFRRS